ncbi:MAG: hypothetical protein PWP51_908 [Clostridiales bacterium]|jgi:sirohydrochlorin cobaltochelatase|nr:hypothetical protein [Clostridiales bacterium]MDN5298355.1 hypothetical protein [Clostridiales bacterium]
MNKKAVLIIAHGSKVQETNDITMAYMAALKAKSPETTFASCYLQLMAPDLRTAIDALYADGVRSIKAFPFFLFNGNHIKEDIPMELNAIRADYPDLTIDFLANIGFDEKLVDIILERVLPL